MPIKNLGSLSSKRKGELKEKSICKSKEEVIFTVLSEGDTFTQRVDEEDSFDTKWNDMFCELRDIIEGKEKNINKIAQLRKDFKVLEDNYNFSHILEKYIENRKTRRSDIKDYAGIMFFKNFRTEIEYRDDREKRSFSTKKFWNLIDSILSEKEVSEKKERFQGINKEGQYKNLYFSSTVSKKDLFALIAEDISNDMGYEMYGKDIEDIVFQGDELSKIILKDKVLIVEKDTIYEEKTSMPEQTVAKKSFFEELIYDIKKMTKDMQNK